MSKQFGDLQFIGYGEREYYEQFFREQEAKPGKLNLRDELIDNLCICHIDPLSLNLSEHLENCPGLRAWVIVQKHVASTQR